MKAGMLQCLIMRGSSRRKVRSARIVLLGRHERSCKILATYSLSSVRWNNLTGRKCPTKNQANDVPSESAGCPHEILPNSDCAGFLGVAMGALSACFWPGYRAKFGKSQPLGYSPSHSSWKEAQQIYTVVRDMSDSRLHESLVRRCNKSL